MTDQQVFDKVKAHLLGQKEKSQEGEACLYRKDELRCAIGCLIPDELYKKGMECRGVFSLLENFPEIISFTGDNKLLLRELQNIHDADYVENWGTRLEQIAESWCLNIGAKA